MIFQAAVSGMLALAAAMMPAGPAPKPIAFHGTIGQQQVAMTLTVDDDTVKSGEYSYDSQKVVIPVVEGKFIGTTAVFADADGNVFHLHLKGSPDATFAKGTSMEGTLNRDDLELKVKLERVEK